MHPAHSTPNERSVVAGDDHADSATGRRAAIPVLSSQPCWPSRRPHFSIDRPCHDRLPGPWVRNGGFLSFNNDVGSGSLASAARETAAPSASMACTAVSRHPGCSDLAYPAAQLLPLPRRHSTTGCRSLATNCCVWEGVRRPRTNWRLASPPQSAYGPPAHVGSSQHHGPAMGSFPSMASAASAVSSVASGSRLRQQHSEPLY